MALAYSDRRATHDIDGVFEPKAKVYGAAARVAARHDDLDDDWINDGVKGYLPGDDPNATTVFARAGLEVRVASPEYLLAMKVFAARLDRDPDDIRSLADLCGLRTADGVLDVVDRYYPRHAIPTRVQYVIEEILDDPDLGGGDAVNSKVAAAREHRTSPPKAAECGKWMKVARSHCILPKDHKGRCRSKR